MLITIAHERSTFTAVNTTYGTVYKTIQYIHDTNPDVEISQYELLFPTTREAILEGWQRHIHNVKRNAPKGSKIVAVVDSIVANPGASMPWKEMVRICKDAGVWAVVDGRYLALTLILRILMTASTTRCPLCRPGASRLGRFWC